MAGRTISFPKGDGSLTHNNREFIANNVCQERTGWNRTYIRESIADAYEKCFGEAVREYNERQKRNDRKISNYMKKIENSDNGENVFYENIVQLGTKDDTSVVDKNGNLTEAAKEVVDLLDEYARTFQERNPNLYLFNCVLHLDEATPHLHIDYIPVADGYKKGMKTRNSMSKALQQMGFEKGKGRYDNEVIDWEARERDYLMGLCRERGIEVEIKGDKRDNFTLPEYKAVMRKVENLEAEAKKLDKQNETLEQRNENLQQWESDLQEQIKEMRLEKRELSEQKEQLANEVHELESGIAEKIEEYQYIDSKLNGLKTKKKDIERNIHVYEEEPKWQLPEPTVFMSAKDYRTKIAMPLVQKLKKVIVDLTLCCIDALENVKKYKNKSNTLQIRVNSLEKCIKEQQTTISSLKQKEQILEDVSAHFGEKRIREVEEAAKQRRKMEQLEKKHKSRGIAI